MKFDLLIDKIILHAQVKFYYCTMYIFKDIGKNVIFQEQNSNNLLPLEQRHLL